MMEIAKPAIRLRLANAFKLPNPRRRKTKGKIFVARSSTNRQPVNGLPGQPSEKKGEPLRLRFLWKRHVARLYPSSVRLVPITLVTIVLVGSSVTAIYRLYGRQHAESVNCGNYMSSIGCGVRLWAQDNGGHLPSDFRSMSNELSTTKILVCPADHKRIPAKDWALLDPTNCSYEILAPGLNINETTNAFFRCRLHGHLGYADGTVFDGKRRRTKVFW
jgi:hypothetical protein